MHIRQTQAQQNSFKKCKIVKRDIWIKSNNKKIKSLQHFNATHYRTKDSYLRLKF